MQFKFDIYNIMMEKSTPLRSIKKGSEAEKQFLWIILCLFENSYVLQWQSDIGTEGAPQIFEKNLVYIYIYIYILELS